MSRKGAFAIAAALGAGMFVSSQADAALTLVVTSTAAPGGPIVIQDNVGLDSNPAPGQISTFAFGLGGYSNVNILASFSNDPGSPSGATLQVTSIAQRDFIAPGIPTLSIEASDEDYIIPTGGGLSLQSSGAGTFSNAAGGFTGMSFQSYAADSNVLFDTTQTAGPLQNDGGLASYAFGPSNTPFAAVGTYSLTNRTTISLQTPGTVSNFSGTTVVVPEPAALGLLGVAGLALLRRRP